MPVVEAGRKSGSGSGGGGGGNWAQGPGPRTQTDRPDLSQIAQICNKNQIST